MKRCAYCGRLSKPTREHIAPASLLERMPEQEMFLARAAKFVGGQPTIRDVCADCNNGPLSQLDAYGARLYDRAFCAIAAAGQRVVFEYEYQMLERWLLKLSFNSARAAGVARDVEILAKWADFVCGGPRPSDRLRIALEVYGPERIPAHLLPDVAPEIAATGQLRPTGLRLSRVEGLAQERFSTLRLVAFNAFHFLLVFGRASAPRGRWKADLSWLLKENPGLTKVPPHDHELELRVSKRSWTDSKAATITKHMSVFTEKYGSWPTSGTDEA